MPPSACSCSGPALAAQTVKKHNILQVVADDLGFSDLSALGSEIQTPNLDKLLANGRLMLDFHAAPNCSPMVFKQGPDVLNPGWQFIPGASWRHPQGPASSLAGLDNHPVVQVTLEDAQAYARWSGRELPSEAQLEYAMRGGLADADFSWGASELPKGRLMANTWQGQFPYHNGAADGFTGTSPVGCFPANGLGLLDAGGNVWELTRSGYRPGHDAQRDAVLDPPGPKLSDSFDPAEPGVPVAEIKGGSHLCSADRCMRYRPSARQPQPVFMATSHVGFRTLRQ